MSAFLHDLRHGIRMLWKSPGFTIIAVLTLTLGVGANAAIFSIVNAAFVRPLPFHEPERLVVLDELDPEAREPADVSPANFLDWRSSARTLEGLAAWGYWGLTLTGTGEPEEFVSARVSANLFDLLGVQPTLGRRFEAKEEEPGNDQVVILSHGLWMRRFGADAKVLGRTFILDGEPRTVVGVMPAGFRFPDDESVEIWQPLAFKPHEREPRGARMFGVIGRLAPGATLEQARGEMQTVANRLGKQFPETNGGWAVTVEPASQALTGSKTELLVLLGAVAFVLFIACANVANLLLTRATDRSREVAVRRALGAGRGRIVRQLLVESLLLGVLGAALGLVLCAWLLDVILSSDPGHIPGWNEIGVDAGVLAFTMLISLLAALAAGLAPAVYATGRSLSDTLREGAGKATYGSRPARTRQLLVVGEIALALVLLVGAGLLINSFMRLQRQDPGFSPRNVLVANLFLPEVRYADDARQARFAEQLLDRAETLPGVLASAAVTTLPLNHVGIDYDLPVAVENRPAGRGSERADFRAATPDYFSTVGIPLLAGRDFTDLDGPDAPRVVVINRTMARRFFPGESPLAKRLRIAGDLHEIVGVVGAVRHRGLDAEPRPEMYVPFAQSPHGGMTVVIRTVPDPLTVAGPLKREIHAIDRDLPISVLTTLDDLVTNSLERQRLNLLLFGGFAFLALLLAVIGIYGVMSYTAAHRTREIGVRLALGARRRDVVGLVVRQALTLTVVGVVLGLVGALVVTRLLSSLLYDVSPTDPPTYLAVAGLLGVVALWAAYLPARRAARVDPMTALRHE